MKTQVTAKSIRESYNGCLLQIGYCNLQHLLKYENPFAYSAGIYGWNCDYYQLGDVCISTGYRPVGKRIPYDMVRSYDKAAEEVLRNYGEFDYETRKAKITNLLAEFIERAREV